MTEDTMVAADMLTDEGTIPRRAAGRPPDMAKRDAILDAAEDVFADEGYGASMDRVAEMAGVSKQTIYKHFAAKDRLFDAMVARRSERITEPVMMADAARPVAEVMADLGARFMDLMVDGQLNCLLRTLLSVGPSTEVARHFYKTGPAVSLSRIAYYLKRQHDEGRLSVPDPMLAAEHFFGLLNGHTQLRGLLGVAAPMGPAEKQARVEAAVRVFLAGYARE